MAWSMEHLQHALMTSVRGLLGGRGSTMASFLVLTVAMWAAVLTYSVVDGIAIRPLPFGSPGDLVMLAGAGPSGSLQPVTPKDYVTWAETTSSFEGVAAARPAGYLSVGRPEEAHTVRALRVTPNLFEVLRVRPFAGRLFGPEHEAPSQDAVITYDAWARLFQSDPAVIGSSMTLGDQPVRVIGVLPENVRFPISRTEFAPGVYVPYWMDAAERENDRAAPLFVVARLKNGVTREQAGADAGRAASTVLLSLHEAAVGSAGRWLHLVLGAAFLLLLIGSLNVAGLQLSRTVVRLPEFATREALGASRLRISANLFGEGVLLAAASAAVAVVAAYMSVDVARAMLPVSVSRVPDIAVDGRVFVAAVGAAVWCGLVSGAAPVLLMRGSLTSLTRASGGTATRGLYQQRLLRRVLTGQIAIVGVLLVGTMLVVATFVVVTTTDLGFDRSNVAGVSFTTSLEDVPPVQRVSAALALRADLLESVGNIDGIASVAMASGVPLFGSSLQSLTIPGYGEVTLEDSPQNALVTPEYFEVMGIRLVRGRLFSNEDSYGAPSVMLISRQMAVRFFAHADPIGQIVNAPDPVEIVGIVEDVRHFGPEAPAPPQFYRPLDQQRRLGLLARGAVSDTFGTLIFKTFRHPHGVESEVRRVVRTVTGAVPQRPMSVFTDQFRWITESRRLNAQVMLAFAAVAVIVTGMGIYATLAFVVRRNVRTIGIRMAMGAEPAAIVRWVLREALRCIAPGVVAGLLVAWMLSGALSSYVFGVSVTSPALYASAILSIMALGLAGSIVPAVAATRVNPVTALKSE